MVHPNRVLVLRWVGRGLIAAVVGSLLAGGLLMLDDHAARASRAANIAAGMGCGGGCSDQPGSCAAEMTKAAQEGVACSAHAKPANTKAAPAAKAHDCTKQVCQDCDPACAHQCEGKDCKDCALDCPHRKASAPTKPAAKPSPPKAPSTSA